MAIKATGTIMENLGDGKHVRVDWNNPEAPPREWYFSNYLWTVHKMPRGEDWKKDGLIELAFEDKSQDVDRFLNDPCWRERYGTGAEDQRFHWTRLYQAIADKLLDYRRDRSPLIEGIHKIGTRV